MTEKRVSVRLAAVGGRQVRAELEGVGEAGARGFGRLSREMELANTRLAAFARRARIAAAAAATALAAAATAMIRSGLSVIDNQAKLAASLDTTVASIQVLERAGDLAGVSMGQVEQAAMQLTKRLSQAAAGTRLRRVCSRRQKSVRRTSGCASSSWPTPMSLHPGTGSYNPAGNSDFTRKAEALALGITSWSTPKATDGAKGGPGQSYGSGGVPPLPAQAAQWPTPAAQNWKGSSEASVTRADGKSRMDILHYRAEQGFTRPDPAIMMHGVGSSPHAPISRPLWASMIASHGRAACRRILKGRSRRRLSAQQGFWARWPRCRSGSRRPNAMLQEQVG